MVGRVEIESQKIRDISHIVVFSRDRVIDENILLLGVFPS